MRYRGYEYLQGYRDATKAWHVYVEIPGRPSHFCGSFATEAEARKHVDELCELGMDRLMADLNRLGQGQYIPMEATP